MTTGNSTPERRFKRKKLLPNGHVEHTPNYPRFLVHGGWLHQASCVVPVLRFRLNTLTKPSSKKQFNIVSSKVEQLLSSKSTAEMLCRPLVGVTVFLVSGLAVSSSSARKKSVDCPKLITSPLRTITRVFPFLAWKRSLSFFWAACQLFAPLDSFKGPMSPGLPRRK